LLILLPGFLFAPIDFHWIATFRIHT